MLRTAHKLTAISNPTPLLLKAKDSSKMMPAYPIPNSNAIATSYITRHDKNNQGYNSRSISSLIPERQVIITGNPQNKR